MQKRDAPHAYGGAQLRSLGLARGTTIAINGRWALFGNGGTTDPINTLFFTAGTDHETHGLFGSLTVTSD